MKKINLGQTLSILANIGVIAGIVFLAVEIRDSNTQAQIASQIAYTGQISGWFSNLGTNEDSAEIYRRGMSDFSGLSEIEKVRFDYLIRSYLGSLIAAISATSAGLGFTGSGFETRQMEIMFEEDGFRQWWAEVDRRTLPLPVVQLLEQFEQSAD